MSADPSTHSATLQHVITGLLANPDLSVTRKRDLRSAVTVYGKIVGKPPLAIPLELGAIRNRLDSVVPAQAKVSRKRWANLRSDLSAAITASGLIEMLKTSGVEPAPDWTVLLRGRERAITNGLSRFARWATIRQIAPADVDDSIMERFFTELETNGLVRDLRGLRRTVAVSWNKLANVANLNRVKVPSHRAPSGRVAWDSLPASFRKDANKYLIWCRVPDPLDEDTRERALAPETIRLRRDHIHLAVSAAVAAGIELKHLTSLSRLVDPEIYKTLLRQRWQEADGQFTNYTRDVAATLIAIAGEWVEVSAKQMTELKALRSKLGGGSQRGFTEKNRALLRQFDNPRLVLDLIRLPDKLWRTALRGLSSRALAFVDLQTALAVDILLHVPLRIRNLSTLRFDKNIHWPQGRGKPAILVLDRNETKNRRELEYELPTYLADRLHKFRHEIAPSIIGKVPDVLFISRDGTPRVTDTVRAAFQKAVLENLGVKLSPHQLRHLAAKFALDDNPGAYEHVRQLLGNEDHKTVVKFYAGKDTRRAGRAHAALLARLRENKPPTRRRDLREAE